MTTSPETSFADTAPDTDLQQLAELATLVTSARDAITDDIVTRLSSAISEGLTLLDRLTRNEGLIRLVQVLDRPENQDLLVSLSKAITAMSQDLAADTPTSTKGGIGGALQLVREPAVQEGLQLLALFSRHLRESMRELNQRHGS